MLFLVFSCKKEKTELTHREGEMTIYADPSNKNLLEALTETYVVKFPKVNFNIIYESESQILQKLQDTIASAAFISKALDEKQTEYIRQKTDVTPRSTLLAYDAVLFITSPDNPIDQISMEQIKAGILTGETQIVFDNGNSGNFNTVIEKLGIDIPKEQPILALENTQDIIEFLQKSNHSIGVIGLNEVSEVGNSKVKEILGQIKILEVIDENGKAQEASVQNILAMNYPFFKGIYFIVREPGFGIGSGFSRFAGSQQGQLIVKRAGLQPNYLYERQVQINLKDVDKE